MHCILLTLFFFIKISIFSKNKFSDRNGDIHIFENAFSVSLNRKMLDSSVLLH